MSFPRRSLPPLKPLSVDQKAALGDLIARLRATREHVSTPEERAARLAEFEAILSKATASQLARVLAKDRARAGLFFDDAQ